MGMQARIGANREVYEAGGARCVINPDFATGKITSIKAGLNALGAGESGTILMLKVDQPRSSDIIRQALDAHHGADDALITIPTCGGKGGHPIAVSGSLLSELRAIQGSTQGMRAATRRHQAETQRVELGAEELLWDVNTPEQYKIALAAAGFRLPEKNFLSL